MFILYENSNNELKLFCVPPSYVEDIDNKLTSMPEYPWENYVKLDDDHPIIKDQVGAVSVGDWEDVNTITRVASPDDLFALKVRVGEFRDFMKMFTAAERLEIVRATQSNPLLKLWYDTALGGATFSLDHPDTAAGLTELVNANLLTQERKDEILNEGDFNSV